MFKALAAIVALTASASVMAQSDVTLTSLAKDNATKTSFSQMVKAISSRLGLTVVVPDPRHKP